MTDNKDNRTACIGISDMKFQKEKKTGYSKKKCLLYWQHIDFENDILSEIVEYK